jgi:hypothetical protein
MGQGGGYMSQNSGNNAGTAGWQGGYVNTQPQRRQNPNVSVCWWGGAAADLLCTCRRRPAHYTAAVCVVCAVQWRPLELWGAQQQQLFR